MCDGLQLECCPQVSHFLLDGSLICPQALFCSPETRDLKWPQQPWSLRLFVSTPPCTQPSGSSTCSARPHRVGTGDIVLWWAGLGITKLLAASLTSTQTLVVTFCDTKSGARSTGDCDSGHSSVYGHSEYTLFVLALRCYNKTPPTINLKKRKFTLAHRLRDITQWSDGLVLWAVGGNTSMVGVDRGRSSPCGAWEAREKEEGPEYKDLLEGRSTPAQAPY